MTALQTHCPSGDGNKSSLKEGSADVGDLLSDEGDSATGELPLEDRDMACVLFLKGRAGLRNRVTDAAFSIASGVSGISAREPGLSESLASSFK